MSKVFKINPSFSDKQYFVHNCHKEYLPSHKAVIMFDAKENQKVIQKQ